MHNHNHNQTAPRPLMIMPTLTLTRAGTALAAFAAALLAVLVLTPTAAHATGDANQTSCPHAEESPGFRNYLPDCRAYELTTPPYTAGAPAFGPHEGAPLMTANGEHLLSQAFAGFCGAENDEEIEIESGVHYEFSRTASGWSCEALDPPASEYPRREFSFASADLSRTLWKLQVPSHSGEEVAISESDYDGWTLAVREVAGAGKGRFTLLGPVVAPGHEPNSEEHPAVGQYSLAGASADLTDVLLSVRAAHDNLWPGDGTVEDHGLSSGAAVQSLYEYRGGSGDEPVLVGVRNGELLEGAPHVNEGADLISQCGVTANAISASGEIVYFTASAADQGPENKHCNAMGEGTGPAVNELYARINGSQTVDISEPSTGPGGDCEGCDESNPKPAVFQGASEDGEKLFFTTEQSLLAGAAGNSLYEYDSSAPVGQRLVLLASEVTGVPATAQDGTRVYFESEAVLAAASNNNGEALNGNGEPAEADQPNLYVYDTETGQTAFVAQQASIAQVTGDGAFALFSSDRELAGTNDTSKVAQLFEYGATTGTVVRVSAGQKSTTGYECPATKRIEEGYNCDGNTSAGQAEPHLAVRSRVGGPSATTSGLSLSENGTVVFSSVLALTPQALQGTPFELEGVAVGYSENLYEYRAGNVYLISPADEASPLLGAFATRLLGVDESGADVFFGTADSLVPQDTDTQYSWYDAREEGGFPAPPPVPECVAEACQGPLSAPPMLDASGSSSVGASGDPAPPLAPKATVKPATKPKPAKCKKGHVRKKPKCVRRKAAKKATRASNHRRASR